MRRLTTKDFVTGIDPLVRRRLAAEVGALPGPDAPIVASEIMDTIDREQRRKHAHRTERAAFNIVNMRAMRIAPAD